MVNNVIILLDHLFPYFLSLLGFIVILVLIKRDVFEYFYPYFIIVNNLEDDIILFCNGKVKKVSHNSMKRFNLLKKGEYEVFYKIINNNNENSSKNNLIKVRAINFYEEDIIEDNDKNKDNNTK